MKHAIDILTRLDSKKKGYYKMIWREMDLKKLLNYKLERVFHDQEHE
jgi:hypothetical protein